MTKFRALGLALFLALLSPFAAMAQSTSAQPTEGYGSNITVTTSWADLVTTYTGMVSAPAFVHNIGTSRVVVFFTASASAPTAGGIVIKPGDTLSGSAAHVWIRSIDSTGIVTVGKVSAAMGDANGGAVQGGSAAGAADSGNPVKIGCIYTATMPTLADGQRGNVSCDSRSNVSVFAKFGLATGNDTVSNAVLASPGSVTAANPSGNPNLMTVANWYYDGTQWVRIRGDTNGSFVVGKGGAGLNSGQVSVGTSSTLVAAARAGRGKIILGVGAANTCAFGNTGVTTTTGYPLQPIAGASLTLDSSAAIYAACSATTTVSFLEQY
ncbi:hypothetical protein [Novosphingobium sp. BL-52-GroH]|uniref:hypothetical protein n=1 Tax=Novosphingobium sp. BL-52-GroH TaxID=3349877 RepID=UPI00384A5132